MEGIVLAYMANSGIWGTMFGVPCAVADQYLKTASEKELKTLLYLLRRPGIACTVEEIAVGTGLPVQQVSDALLFWQQNNVLTSDNAEVPASIMTPPEQSVPTAQSSSAETKTADKDKIPVRQRQNRTPSEIARLMSEQNEIAELFKTAENQLGKLTHTHQNSLIWMSSYLGLKSEVIITLLSYCVSIEKTNPAYIEKIACDWAENEINTLDRASAEAERLKISREYTSSIMRILEMKRRPTTKQQAIIDGWKSEGYSFELIHHAYEITVENIDKLSFEYIDKILVSWKRSGLMTLDDVKAANVEYKKKRSASESESDDFDVDKYKIFVNNF